MVLFSSREIRAVVALSGRRRLPRYLAEHTTLGCGHWLSSSILKRTQLGTLGIVKPRQSVYNVSVAHSGIIAASSTMEGDGVSSEQPITSLGALQVGGWLF